MPPIVGTNGSHLRVYESSAAEEACVWLMITGINNSDDCHPSLTTHLTLTELTKLGEQIEWMKANHYQGPWVDDAPPSSTWRRLWERVRWSIRG